MKLHINEDLYKIINEQYKSSNNYYIRNNNVKNNLCYIYFSSNALYAENTIDCFKQKVLIQNRYEWERNSASIKPQREIFVRDVWRSWYVKGINAKIDNYKKLTDFLKVLTLGYTTRCVGVSSGGFIATIISIELCADACYALAAQFSLSNHFDHLKTNIFLKDFQKKPNSNYYLEIQERIKNSKTKIIYLLPCLSKQDIIQSKLLPNSENILVFRINDPNHGTALYPCAIAHFISLSYEECKIECFKNKYMKNKIFATIRIGGLLPFVRFAVKRTLKHL